MQKDLNFLELSVKLSKEKAPSGDIYRIKVFDYDEYFIREVSLLDEEVAKLVYDITANTLTLLDRMLRDADDLWTKRDERIFIKRYSKVKRVLEKTTKDLEVAEYPIEESFYSPDGYVLSILGQVETCKSYLCLPFSEIKKYSKKLYALFEEFKTLFEDHPTEDNTFLVFLLKDVDGIYETWDIFFVCAHFEHNFIDDLMNLSIFMSSFANAFNTHHSQASVSVLQGNGEYLILQLYAKTPYSRIPNWIRKLLLQELDLKDKIALVYADPSKYTHELDLPT